MNAAAVEVTGLRKSYGAVQAVRGIDVAIDVGETVALLGPNGAGKSTTIDMILGLARPDGAGCRCSAVRPPSRSTPGRSAGCCRAAR